MWAVLRSLLQVFFFEKIGKRIEHLNTEPAQADEKKVASSSVATKAISMIAKGFIAIGNIFKAHLGLKVGREALRAELRNSRQGFFAQKVHSVNVNINELKLAGVDAMLEQLGTVDEHSPAKTIDRYNALQRRKANLVHEYIPKIINKKIIDEVRETLVRALEFSCSI
jgi:hypothetical protein